MDWEKPLTAVAEIVTFCALPGATPTLDKLTESEKFGALPEDEEDVEDDEFIVPPQPHINTAVITMGKQHSWIAFFRDKMARTFAR
jgi:hypothetical protein